MVQKHGRTLDASRVTFFAAVRGSSAFGRMNGRSGCRPLEVVPRSILERVNLESIVCDIEVTKSKRDEADWYEMRPQILGKGMVGEASSERVSERVRSHRP